MRAYQITGGDPLRGEITISGAKNAVLPIMAASMLCGGEFTLRHCPNISDVENTIRILHCLGCKVKKEGQTLYIDTYSADRNVISPHLMKRMRAAVIFLGALLTRFGEARISHPGGCKLGERPIDLHLMGLRHMGYCCEYQSDELLCYAEKLHGCTIALPFPSVGATENIMLAALRCPDEVVICNAAKEPEISDLVVFLRKCGAQISGENTSVLRIYGGKLLHGAVHTILPDRMEAATYLCAAAATRGSICLKNVRPEHFVAVTEVLRRAGCDMSVGKGEMTLACSDLHAVSPIRTAPYDGFPTDAQAPMMAAMATAQGVSVFEENIFSERYRHVPGLQQMGAKIYAAGRCAVVEGVKTLHGAVLEATDLRGGAAMVLAALGAEGESTITNIAHIARGYAGIVDKLSACGARIRDTE